MKSLPSLKEKKRYLVFEVISEHKVGFSEVKESINRAVLGFVGSHGFARLKPRLLADLWDSQRQRGVVVVSRKFVDHMRASLCLISGISRYQVIIRTLGVSGILKKGLARFY